MDQQPKHANNSKIPSNRDPQSLTNEFNDQKIPKGMLLSPDCATTTPRPSPNKHDDDLKDYKHLKGLFDSLKLFHDFSRWSATTLDSRIGILNRSEALVFQVARSALSRHLVTACHINHLGGKRRHAFCSRLSGVDRVIRELTGEVGGQVIPSAFLTEL